VNIQSILSDKIKQAMIAAGADEQCDALIRQSGKPQFGDYQANGIMAAAKKLGLNPREFAQKVLDHADLSDVAEKTEIAAVKRSRILRFKSSVAISVKVTTKISSTFNGREKQFSPACKSKRR